MNFVAARGASRMNRSSLIEMWFQCLATNFNDDSSLARQWSIRVTSVIFHNFIFVIRAVMIAVMWLFVANIIVNYRDYCLPSESCRISIEMIFFFGDHYVVVGVSGFLAWPMSFGRWFSWILRNPQTKITNSFCALFIALAFSISFTWSDRHAIIVHPIVAGVWCPSGQRKNVVVTVWNFCVAFHCRYQWF